MGDRGSSRYLLSVRNSGVRYKVEHLVEENFYISKNSCIILFII